MAGRDRFSDKLWIESVRIGEADARKVARRSALTLGGVNWGDLQPITLN